MEGGLAHFDVVLTAFQFAVSVALLYSGYPDLYARVSTSLLVAANAVVTLASVVLYVTPSWQVVATVSAAADDATAPLIILVVASLVLPMDAPAARWTKWVVGAAAGLVFLLGFSPWGQHAIFLDLVQGILVFVAYGAACAALAFRLASRPTWPTAWILAAFLVRGADFAVRHPGGNVPLALAIAQWALVTCVLAALARVLMSQRIEMRSRVALLGSALVGAALGIAGRLGAPDPIQFQESLITLSLGRPAFFAIGFLVEVLLAGAASGATLLVATLAVPAALSREIVATRKARSSIVAAKEVEDWERLLEWLATLPDGASANRREIGEALGIDRRNVQRLVDAANRAPGSQPGQDIVRAWLDRGKRNQLEHRYALTNVGRVRQGRPPLPAPLASAFPREPTTP